MSLYDTQAWRDLSHTLKTQAKGKCQECGAFTEFSKLSSHHIIEVTAENEHDANITLNPANIRVVCGKCHNKSHRRFGHKRTVYLVWGPPLSGKTTLVRDMMQPGDLVLDLDALWQAITFMPEYVHPNNVRFNVFKLRDELLDQIKTRYGTWADAYVIGGYPNKHERERLAKSLGAVEIFCDVTREECYNRIASSGRPAEWREYIDKWWAQYTPPTGGF